MAFVGGEKWQTVEKKKKIVSFMDFIHRDDGQTNFPFIHYIISNEALLILRLIKLNRSPPKYSFSGFGKKKNQIPEKSEGVRSLKPGFGCHQQKVQISSTRNMWLVEPPFPRNQHSRTFTRLN